MRARAAYIRSLGTTSILVAAALLMLAVVGAVVGFHRWPDGAVGEAVPSVPLKPAPQPVRDVVRNASASRLAVSLTRADRATAASTAGLVKMVPIRSPQAIGYPEALAPGHAGQPVAAPAPPSAAGHGSPPPLDPANPPSPPSDPQQIQALIDQLVGSVPPPPVAAQPDGGLSVTVPIVGTTVSLPPGHAQ